MTKDLIDGIAAALRQSGLAAGQIEPASADVGVPNQPQVEVFLVGVERRARSIVDGWDVAQVGLTYVLQNQTDADALMRTLDTAVSAVPGNVAGWDKVPFSSERSIDGNGWSMVSEWRRRSEL